MSEKEINEEKLIGKTILVGMTFYNENDELVERNQSWGEIVDIDENTIFIKQKNGEEFTIPNDLSAIEVANPGVYKLHSTGEKVENPDYISTWNITLPD